MLRSCKAAVSKTVFGILQPEKPLIYQYFFMCSMMRPDTAAVSKVSSRDISKQGSPCGQSDKVNPSFTHRTNPIPPKVINKKTVSAVDAVFCLGGCGVMTQRAATTVWGAIKLRLINHPPAMKFKSTQLYDVILSEAERNRRISIRFFDKLRMTDLFVLSLSRHEIQT